MAQVKAAQCWICGGACNSSTVAQRAQVGRARITEEAVAARRKLDLEFALREAMADIGAARREVDRLTAEEARISKLSTSATALGTALPMSREEAETQLRAMHSRRAGWAAARRGEELALAAEKESVEWGQLADALSKALGVLVEKAKIGFEARVQKFLPSSDIFGIDLLDGDREILRVGLRRNVKIGDKLGDAQLDAALSGAEWSRVTAALALATAPATSPCVVVPEERAFDANTLAIVLEAFDKAIQGDDAPQIIVTSPVEPVQIPPGWTVIRVGELPEVTKAPKAAKEKEPESLLEKIGIVGPPLEKGFAQPDAPAGTSVFDEPKPVDLEARDAREREALNLPKRRGRPPGKKNAQKAETPGAVTKEMEEIAAESRKTSPAAEAPLEFFPVKDAEGNTVGLKPKKEEPEAPRSSSDLFDPFA
jgi:hypothetical protein